MSNDTTPHTWSPPPSVVDAGNRARVRYAFAEETADGEQRAPSEALRALAAVVLARVRGVPSVGMVRPSSRRAGVSHDPHRAGIAADLMLTADASRVARGDALANLLVTHAEELGLQYVLWSRWEWSASGSGRRWERYTGSDPHVDHVHVELGPVARGWSAADMRAKAERVFTRGGAGAVVLGLAPWLLAVAVAVLAPSRGVV